VRHNLTGFEEWDWLDVDLGLESHGPVVLENGTILTFTRSYDAPKPNPESAIWLVRADKWNGTYSIVGSRPVFKEDLEDTFMWCDPRGNFHALFHAFDGANVGGHAYSRNGIDWTLSKTFAYTKTVEAADGTSITYPRRERPHLTLDGAGNPAFLTNGVTHPPADWSFTLVQGIRAAP
jgi:hypothetical protein